jgi:hypothetical protein
VLLADLPGVGIQGLRRGFGLGIVDGCRPAVCNFQFVLRQEQRNFFI